MKNPVTTSFISVFLVTIFIYFVIIGYAFCDSCNVERKTNETFSLKGTGEGFGRGIVNTAFCWLEIPREVKERLRNNKWDRVWHIIPNTLDIAIGTIRGTSRGIMRGIGGVCEVILSPFPPYNPMITPAYPPYFKANVKSEDKRNDSDNLKESTP